MALSTSQLHGQLTALKILLLAVIEKNQPSEEWYAQMALYLATMEQGMLASPISDPIFLKGFQQECQDLIQELGKQRQRLYP